jgi:hypothetical protein
MKTKIIPFDLEMAKKIQAGEIKGRIITTEGNSVRIICFDRKGFADKIIGLVAIDAQSEYGYELEISYCEDGSSSKQNRHDLIIELPKEAPKHEFKPFDKVLVRSEETGYCIWQAAFYSHFENNKGDGHHVTTAGDYYLDGEVIPYAGNEHLVGTTNNPKEE